MLFVKVTTLLPYNPLITGFNTPCPVDIEETPLILSNEITGLFVKFILLRDNFSTLVTLFFSDSLKGVDTTTSIRLTGMIESFSAS